MQLRRRVALLITVAVLAMATGSVVAADPPGWSGSGYNVTFNESIVVGEGRSAHVHDTVQTADGGYLYVGGERKGGNYPGPTKATVWKISANGSLEWSRFLAGNTSLATTIARTDTGYVIAGVQPYRVRPQDSPIVGDRLTPLVWRISASGDIQSNQSVPIDGFRYPESIVAVEDGVILAGIANGIIHEGLTGTGSGWIAKVTDDGSVAWDTTAGGHHGGYFTDVIVTSSGVTAIGTRRGNDSKPWLYQVGSDGAVIQNTTIGTGVGTAEAAIRTDGGDLIVTGTLHRNWTGDDSTEQRLAVWRVEPDGSVVWDRVLSNSSAATATDIAVLSSARVAAVGEINKPGADTGLIEVAVNGTVTGVATFGGEWPEYPVGVSDGGNRTVAITGYLERTDFSHIEDAWLVRVSLTGQGTGSVGDIANQTTTTTTGSNTTTQSTTSGDRGPGFTLGGTLLVLTLLGGYLRFRD